MKNCAFFSFVACFLFLPLFTRAQTAAGNTAVMLPNGWRLSPVGKSLPLGDLPLNIAVSPDRKMLAVTNNGVGSQTVQLIDAVSHIQLDAVTVGKSWLGLAFSDDSKNLYVSGGNDNFILRFDIKNKRLLAKDTFFLGKPWPEKISIAGITLDDRKHLLYAVTKENNSLYVIDIPTKKTLGRYDLGGEAYTCILSNDKKTLYITCWGCDKVVLFDTEKRQLRGSVIVGDNPNDMALNTKGTLLFVSNANDNSVSVIDLQRNTVTETLNAALFPAAPPGSTTNSIALSEDDKTLFIANADNNCLAVFDVSVPGHSKSKGFIPVGWYPTCVRVANRVIFVSNGKGFSSLPDPFGPNPYGNVNYQHSDTTHHEEQYIGSLFQGTLSIIPVPDEKTLSVYSQQVYRNTPYTKEKEERADGQAGNPIPTRTGDPSPIKYVFYIIKENRTYDQVLADMPGGNGDTSLLLFGKNITPNLHAIAGDFVLFDNFYVDSEVSADGHNWSLGGYADDYLEKTWPTSYGGRGGSYDAEGNRDIANNKNGFIWDFCKRFGVSYRTYGEFADDFKPNIPVLQNHFCPYYTSWDQSVMDTTRFSEWKRDFDSLLSIGQVPQLNTLRFINDHTQGLRLGKPSPNAQVADNDLATGLFVDYLSHSPIWKESAVFILEDDAQNGPDHVDAHRSTLYVAGGFVKRKFIDHTMYSTTSVLRTMELILGLPPMSQYDAAAEPLWRCFSDTANTAPFHARKAQANLFEKNVAMNQWQKMSEDFNFDKEDNVNEDDFNQVLWWAVKGDSRPCPSPVRSAFIREDEDTDD